MKNKQRLCTYRKRKKRKKMAAILFTKHKNWGEIMTKKERKKKEKERKK